MISTKNITFSYQPQNIFDFPDLHCTAGETLLITGQSGTGKTTLLHLLGGLLRPASGEIWIDGTDLVTLTARKSDIFRGKNIGIIFQQAHFVASLSVLDNLVLAGWLPMGQKMPKKAQRLLDALNIGEQAKKKPAQLSTGQQQRVAIARALMNDPQVLLADEPTSNLDDYHCDLVAQLLAEQSKEAEAALIIVTHDNRLKTRFAQQIDLS